MNICIVYSKSINNETVLTETEMNSKSNFNFLQNIWARSKSIKTEAVFASTQMNNKGEVNFLQIMKCAQKVSRLELHLQRH